MPLPLGIHLLLFALLAGMMIGGWLLCVAALRRSAVGVHGVLAGTCVLALPLLLLTGIYSDDVYLYNAYGRELAVYGANPFVVPPSAFPDDPHLKWVYWKWLPSAYGPVWLLVSAPLSALAGTSINAAVILYRAAALAAVLATGWLIWRTLRDTHPREAVVAAAFFAWNPFVLFEAAASAHNDALMVVFICAAVAAWNAGRMVLASVMLACAAMVKPFAAILLVPLAVATWARRKDARAARQVATMGAAAIATALALYAPLWAGDALLRNIASNPAAGVYMNTPWELAAVQISRAAGIGRSWLEAVVLDRARDILLAAAFVIAALVALRRRQFVPSALVLWVGFCVSLAWIWPWYFVPAIALAALSGARAWWLGVALSLGGLLFYLAWPPPSQALSWIYAWRSVLLFGPAAIVLLVWFARAVLAVIERAGGDPFSVGVPESPSASQ